MKRSTVILTSVATLFAALVVGFAVMSGGKSDLKSIKRVDKNSFVVAATVVDKVLDGQIGGAEAKVAHNAAGEFIGFSVDKVARGSVLSQLGLKPEDVVRAVNGKGLTSMEAIKEARRNVQQSSEVVLVVSRDGEQLRLTYEVKRAEGTKKSGAAATEAPPRGPEGAGRRLARR